MNNVRKTNGSSLAFHLLRWLAKANKQSQLRIFAFKNTCKITDHCRTNLVAALYGRQHASPWPAWAVWEKQLSIYAAIGALFQIFSQSMRIKEIISPPLKLIFVALCQFDR